MLIALTPNKVEAYILVGIYSRRFGITTNIYLENKKIYIQIKVILILNYTNNIISPKKFSSWNFGMKSKKDMKSIQQT